MDDTSRKYVAKYLGDMHSLLEHGLKAIAAQVGERQMKDHPEALQAVQDFERTLQTHVAMIDARMKALGSTSATTAVQDAASTIAGIVAGVYNQVRTEAASKSVRDDYTFLSHCAIAYLMLHTTASSIGDPETAALADRGYRDMARMIMVIDRLMPSLVIQELRGNGLPSRDTAEECRRLVHDAWSRQPAAAGI